MAMSGERGWSERFGRRPETVAALGETGSPGEVVTCRPRSVQVGGRSGAGWDGPVPWQVPDPRDRRSESWWEAHTVVVTREAEPGRWEFLRRLVVPVGWGRLAFRLSSLSPEAGQLWRDRRVLVQVGDRRGRPALGSREHEGDVVLFGPGPLAEAVAEGLRVKYGPRVALARLGHRMMFGSAPYADLTAVITVHQDVDRLAVHERAHRPLPAEAGAAPAAPDPRGTEALVRR